MPDLGQQILEFQRAMSALEIDILKTRFDEAQRLERRLQDMQTTLNEMRVQLNMQNGVSKSLHDVRADVAVLKAHKLRVLTVAAVVGSSVAFFGDAILERIKAIFIR